MIKEKKRAKIRLRSRFQARNHYSSSHVRQTRKLGGGVVKIMRACTAPSKVLE